MLTRNFGGLGLGLGRLGLGRAAELFLRIVDNRFVDAWQVIAKVCWDLEVKA